MSTGRERIHINVGGSETSGIRGVSVCLTDTQAYRHTNTDKQTGVKADGQTENKAEKHGKQTERQTGRQNRERRTD